MAAGPLFGEIWNSPNKQENSDVTHGLSDATHLLIPPHVRAGDWTGTLRSIGYVFAQPKHYSSLTEYVKADLGPV